MRFTVEEITDMAVALEEIAIQKDAKQTVELCCEGTTEKEEDETYTPVGWKIVSPYVETRMMSQPKHWPYALIGLTRLSDGEVSEWVNDDEPYYLKEMSGIDFTKLRFNEEPIKDKATLFQVLGLGEMVVLATKVPRVLGANFKAMCQRQGETPSSRLRDLLRENLREYLATEAKRLMFKEVAA